MTETNGDEVQLNGTGINVLELIRMFNDSLHAMEARLGAKMDDNSRIASERWIKHDHDAERIMMDIENRFVKIEANMETRTCEIQKALEVHIAEARERWQREHDEEVAFDARLTPVKGIIGYVQHNWKTILLLIMSVLAILGFSSDTLQRILGI